MRAAAWVCLVSLVTVVGGCGGDDAGEPAGDVVNDVDSDEDGLSDSEEAELGTDPNLADTDGDGLGDGDEVDGGTNPLASDSDDDGYTDLEELDAGTDPNDASDVIYAGGWPYNLNKAGIPDPGWDSQAGLGAVLPHYIAVDQFHEPVDLYDLAGQPVVLDIGTKWCEPCKAMAHWLATGDVALAETYAWWKPEHASIRDKVVSGEILWVTVLFSKSESSGPAVSDDCEAWHDEFPNDQIPVLADTALELHDYIDVQSYPAMSVLDGDLKFIAYSNSGPYAALAKLLEL